MIQIPINIFQGESYNPPPISIVTGCFPNYTPISLVGYNAIFTIRNVAQDPIILLQASPYTGQIIILPGAGQILINIAASYLTPLAPLCGVYDLFLFAPSGNSQRILGGQFNIIESVLQ
jgi:hypothetical protein